MIQFIISDFKMALPNMQICNKVKKLGTKAKNKNGYNTEQELFLIKNIQKKMCRSNIFRILQHIIFERQKEKYNFDLNTRLQILKQAILRV